MQYKHCEFGLLGSLKRREKLVPASPNTFLEKVTACNSSIISTNFRNSLKICLFDSVSLHYTKVSSQNTVSKFCFVVEPGSRKNGGKFCSYNLKGLEGKGQ